MNPMAIYQTAIDTVSRAVLAGDFESYIPCYDLPFLVRTSAAHFIIHRRCDMRPAFDAVSSALRTLGVTQRHRVARGHLRRDTVAKQSVHGILGQQYTGKSAPGCQRDVQLQRTGHIGGGGGLRIDWLL